MDEIFDKFINFAHSYSPANMTIDVNDIMRLTENHEGVDVEFKETTGQLDRGMETLCGMLNGQGGTVVFGVTNAGKIKGQEIGDKTTRLIGEALRRFEPSVDFQPHYIKLPDSDKQLIVFQVIGDNPSAPFAYDGRPYQRFDSVTSVMPMEKFMRLHEKNVGLKYWWEKEVNPNLTFSMIDEALLVKMIAAAVNQNRLTGLALRDDTKTALRRLNLMTDEGLRNAAAVLFGKDMWDEYPQCSLRMARFKGVKRVDFRDNQLVTGNIFELMDAAMTFFFKHLSLTGTTHHRIYREEELEIPSNALREACLNAFTHRAWQFETHQVNIAIYDDRVEIENIGRFPIGVNPNELVRSEEENTSMPPNEVIANVLYLTGSIEHWGRGLALIYDECERVGVERPRYINDGHFVRVVFKRPDMSKWTPDGFINGTVTHENDIVKANNGTEPSEQNIFTAQVQPKYSPSTAQVEKIIKALGTDLLRANQIMELCGFKSMRYFRANYIRKALEDGALWLEFPDSPNAPNQRYRLSDKAVAYYLSISKETK